MVQRSRFTVEGMTDSRLLTLHPSPFILQHPVKKGFPQGPGLVDVFHKYPVTASILIAFIADVFGTGSLEGLNQFVGLIHTYRAVGDLVEQEERRRIRIDVGNR